MLTFWGNTPTVVPFPPVRSLRVAPFDSSAASRPTILARKTCIVRVEMDVEDQMEDDPQNGQ